MSERPLIIDALQYNHWSEEIFRQMQAGGVCAVHVTICYHEDFRETVEQMVDWNRRFERYPDLIVPGRSAEAVRRGVIALGLSVVTSGRLMILVG